MIPIRDLKIAGHLKLILPGCLLLLCVVGYFLLTQTSILTDQQISETNTTGNTKPSPQLTQPSGVLLYRFLPLSSDIVHMIEIWKQDGKYQMVHRLRNGSQYVQTVIPSADLKRFTPVKARRGEYYLLTHSDNTLEAWDKDRRINRSLRTFFTC